ncbi:MAG: hypothetical protein HUU46_22570 [Candidatus Hydrogenedentes bacterium]|nr:hypothetical protein [Candidatus Hydrogenedentota bacterium]
MRREQIIAIVVVLLLAGSAGAGYQFYFRPALEKFAADQTYLEGLNTKLQTLKRTFPSGRPEAAVQLVAEKTQPWHDTLEQRARQFTIRDFKKLDPLPKTLVLRAYYDQMAQKMATDLATELAIKGVYYNPNISFYFGAARPGTLAGKSVNELQVIHWLSSIKLGTSIMRMLVDSDMLGIENLRLWTPRTTAEGFESYAVGVSMWMTMDQFCKFLEKLHGDETMCIRVNGFRMTNTSLRAYVDPPLRIELVFEIDVYNYVPQPPAAVGAGAAGAPATGANAAMQQLRAQRAGAAAPKPQASTSWWRKWLPL